MNHEKREDLERFRRIQDNTSELRFREIKILFEELRREGNQERWNKIGGFA